MVKETYLINEAAKEVHVEAHVLRYWEEELELPIKRNPQGHRIYTQEDIDRFLKIKSLKDKGLQLKAVKTVLSDNPFAQKQLTKISRSIVDSEGEEHEEKRHDENNHDEIHDDSHAKKNMIEIKSIKSIMRPKNEVSEVKTATTEEQTERLQYLFQKLVKEAVAANNEEMISKIVERISESIKGDVCKELDYQFRLMEERDDERETNRMSEEDRRNEEYYKRIDELLRQYRGKGKFPKESKTISFPLANKEKEPKPKKEFHLFKKTPEAKFQ